MVDLPDCLMNLTRDPERLQTGLIYVQGGYEGDIAAMTTAWFTWDFANDGLSYVIDMIEVWFDCRGPIDSWVEYYPDSAQPTNSNISDKQSEFHAIHRVSRYKPVVFTYPARIRVNIANVNSKQRWVACTFNWYTFAMP